MTQTGTEQTVPDRNEAILVIQKMKLEFASNHLYKIFFTGQEAATSLLPEVQAGRSRYRCFPGSCTTDVVFRERF